MREAQNRMRIVRPAGYPSRFNTPRHSRHSISTRRWLPLHKVWQPLEVALLMPTAGADLVATFNRIPLGTKPFVISYESHLPRLFAYEKTSAFRYFTARLAGDRCRRIIPISQFARSMFLRQHDASPDLASLKEKLSEVVYPSVEVAPRPETPESKKERLSVLFVGSHFARKGGLALLLAARRAAEDGLPVDVHIVSDLTVGCENGVWTDPPTATFFEDYRPLLGLPNVHLHGRLPNRDLLDLMRRCDVNVLPTLCDTFGYSVLESFAAGLPAIGTRAYALPELITPGVNGMLIDLDTDDAGEWRHLFKMDRAGETYGRVFRRTMDMLSEQLVVAFRDLLDEPDVLSRMKEAAHRTAMERFEAKRQSATLDDLYERVT